MIDLSNICHEYASPKGGSIAALQSVSLKADAGKFLALQGPSGCGKSTLLLIAGGMLHPSSGDVRVSGQDVYALGLTARAAFRSSEIGFVFQQFHLIPYLSVVDNVLAAGIGSGRNDRGRAVALLQKFGLESRIDHTPLKLSTGERQRAALARAIYNEPKVLLADEPTGNLDAENAETVLQSLAEFARSGGSVLMVTHDDHAASFANEVVRMESGKLCS